MISTDPTGGAKAWSSTTIDSTPQMLAVSCPSATFCAATDITGNVLTSTDPTGGSAAWSSVKLNGQLLNAISCPSSSFCAALGFDSEGHSEVWTSTEPTGGASAWHSAAVDAGNELTAIDCLSSTFCVAVDHGGNELFSTHPTDGTSSWSTPEAIAERVNGTPEPLNAVSCPTTTFCAASDGYNYISYEGYSLGNVVASSNPTGGAGTWAVSPAIAGEGTSGVFSLACPLERYCLTVDYSGNVYSLEATGSLTFATTHLEPFNYFRAFTGISCPNARLCVAVDTEGNVFTGTAAGDPTPTEPPSPVVEPPASKTGGQQLPIAGPPDGGPAPLTHTQLAALLTRQLTPTGKAAKIGALLKHGGLTLAVQGLSAGTLTVQWYVLPPGAKSAKQAKARPVLVASGKLTLAPAGAGNLKLQLTAAGRRLLKHARRVKVVASEVFVASGGASVKSTTTLVLRR